MPRSRLDKDSSHAFGITPFMFSDSDGEDKPVKMTTTVSDREVTVSWSVNKISSEMLDLNSSVSRALRTQPF
jgi:hypothetical protein